MRELIGAQELEGLVGSASDDVENHGKQKEGLLESEAKTLSCACSA